jgi:hypothetical protein
MQTQKQLELERMRHQWEVEAFNRQQAWQLEKAELQSRSEFGADLAMQEKKRAEFQTKMAAIEDSAVLDGTRPKEEYGGLTEKAFMKQVLTAKYTDLPEVARQLTDTAQMRAEMAARPKTEAQVKAEMLQDALGGPKTPGAAAPEGDVFSMTPTQPTTTAAAKVVSKLPATENTQPSYVVQTKTGPTTLNSDHQVLAIDTETGNVVLASMSEVAENPRYTISSYNITTESQEYAKKLARGSKPAQQKSLNMRAGAAITSVLSDPLGALKGIHKAATGSDF